MKNKIPIQKRSAHKRTKPLTPRSGLFDLLTVAGLTVICGALTLFWFIPTLQEIKHAEIQYTETAAQKIIIEDSIMSRITAQERFASLKDTAFLDAAFPSKQNIIPFVETMERIASEKGLVHLLTFHTDEEKMIQNTITIPATITLTGNYAQLLQYIQRLEQENFYINTTALTIQERSATGTIDVVIEVLTYWSE